MASSSYEENWEHYRWLEQQADQTRNQYEVARAAHTAAEVGTIERVQLESVVVQKEGEARTAETALNAFVQDVRQTQPKQAEYLEMGVAPEATKLVDATDIAMSAAPVIAENMLTPDFLEGTGFPAGEVIKESVEALKNAPDYIEGKLNQRTDQQIADAPPPSLDSRIENAVLDEIQKTDLQAFKQVELDKLKLQHAEQTEKQEVQLAKFTESQADKPADVQAKQAELAEKARAELAEKQDREMKAKAAELERSQAEAREAQALAKSLEDQRGPR
jgi:hypothetical protein